MDFPLFGMVLEPWGGGDRDYGDGDSNSSITSDQLADVTFPYLYNFMNGLDGYSYLRGLFVNFATTAETRSGMTTVTTSFTREV